jgi:hypothetical protein
MISILIVEVFRYILLPIIFNFNAKIEMKDRIQSVSGN